MKKQGSAQYMGGVGICEVKFCEIDRLSISFDDDHYFCWMMLDEHMM